MRKDFENIELSESVILGWKTKDRSITFYMEFLLTNLHEKFVQFDPNTEFGCFKIGKIDFFNIKNLRGLDIEMLVPVWNENLSEYKDVYEVDSITIKNSLVKIQAEQLDIVFEYDDFDLSFEETNRFENTW